MTRHVCSNESIFLNKTKFTLLWVVLKVFWNYFRDFEWKFSSISLLFWFPFPVWLASFLPNVFTFHDFDTLVKHYIRSGLLTLFWATRFNVLKFILESWNSTSVFRIYWIICIELKHHLEPNQVMYQLFWRFRSRGNKRNLDCLKQALCYQSMKDPAWAVDCFC